MNWHSTTEGIEYVELIPDIDERAVLSRLESSIAQSAYFKAGVCYWTIAAKRFVVPLANALSPPGFLCVDLHKPTDIDRLDELKRAGADVYLHLKKPIHALEPDTKNPVPSSLFHAKMLIFYRQGSVELWIGSHNWTARSLTGVNMEASVVIRAKSGSAIHHQAEAYLDTAKSRFHRFQSDLVPYYKWLQGETESTTPVVVFSGESLDELAETSIVVLGESVDEFRTFRTVSSTVHIMALAENGETFVYEARVRQSGILSSDDRVQAFASMRVVYRAQGVAGHPELSEAQAVVAEAYPKARYFVVFDVIATDLNEDCLHPKRNQSRWVHDDESGVYEQGIGQAMRDRFGWGDRPLVKGVNAAVSEEFGRASAAMVLRSAVELEREQPFYQRLVIRKP